MTPMEGFLGLGSNKGDRAAALKAGLCRLEGLGVRILVVSSVLETEPVGCEEQDLFLNQVARVRFDGSPEELLARTQEVERLAGRVRSRRNEPRPLDIDLLLFPGHERSDSPPILPHPRMWRRRFVLVPLAELAPDLRNPLTGRTILEELEGLLEGEVRPYNPGLRVEERSGQ
ncbi:MAG: 2-amino-4-hydroxy-6-hydroxymethyldihydropteridine diphosphokinase [Acidobacteria bacterium]|uniref:2-amino-4-hydroxy-6-hydroxymethyldihydropteridine pyrophosphokinase n=1 Tax=Candidatus Polarisedimenticola svalbardensis TaxID=2886004 RepID=A0A8J6Y8Z4_9BACT|nr:2-amino-4-hydroxy-6-hydroxymethyldihydropteridine diphosphokinase [Candidatus Polarisedimenticola svalbardensis]